MSLKQKREQLSAMTQNDLLVIKTSKCEVKDFSPESSIRLWWEAKTRIPNQRNRKLYAARKKSTVSSSTSTSSSNSTVSLLDSESTDNDEEEEAKDEAICLMIGIDG